MSEKRKYTLGEEIFNSVSHGVGACLSVAGTAVMIVASVIHTDVWGIVSSVYIRCFADYSLHNVNSLSFVYKQKSQGFFSE